MKLFFGDLKILYFSLLTSGAQGCSVGRHNPEKPPEEPKPQNEVSVDIPEVQVRPPPLPNLLG